MPVGTEYSDYIWAKLYNVIGNEYGVAGLMGNLEAESGNVPFRKQGDVNDPTYRKSIEYTENINNGNYSRSDFIYDEIGYSLAQWTFWTRKRDYWDYVKQQGKLIGDTEASTNYLIEELQKSYRSVWSTLRSAASVRQASDVVLHDFENPAVQTESVEIARARIGQSFYDYYSSGEPPSPPDPPDPPTPPPLPPTYLGIPKWLMFKFRKKIT